MQKKQPSIIFKNVSKEFFLQEEKTFKEVIPHLVSGKPWAKKLTVFEDISFTINQGETVGIVGKNGAGKSTIMKLIAGVTYPTTGSVIAIGKIAPLIELAAGFHSELTGHENIFLNAAILGMHKKEIEALEDEIITFSELQEFIHTPVKRYSTGMLMRLAFSIAVKSPADILLVDEVLAVGDTEFQNKCLNYLKNIKNSKEKIIIFVSHDKDAVLEFCDRALLLENGAIAIDDLPKKVFARYEPANASGGHD